MNIYIHKSQSNLPNRLQLYMTSFLIGYNSICKVDICYNNDLKEEVYMEQPLRFVAQGEIGKFCRLLKSLYGLK